MQLQLKALFVMLLLLSPSVAQGQDQPAPEAPVAAAPAAAEPPPCPEGYACVAMEDLKAFIQLAKERKCLDETKPEFKLDAVTIITDQDGRVFYTGKDPKHPYKLEMKWCHYTVEGTGEIQIVAAMSEPPTWGFRFRPKAYLGFLPVRMLQDGHKFVDGVDAGLMLDFFYIQWFNLNVAAGFRSAGLGAGFDLTKNFGLYTGYAFTWDIKPTPHSVSGSIYFAF